MIPYSELVQYIKDCHVSWNTELFEVLRGFFEARDRKYSIPLLSPPPSSSPPPRRPTVTQTSFLPEKEFKHPDNGEYSTQDVCSLFDT